ncbi:MAG: 50S ribosomal protein L10 [Actinobacteria bacterium]|nr:50S ribosomal protein L10 [Actinomycetota bacterium]
MSEARAAKVAVVDEVRERFSDSDSLVLTEYRNLDVPAMASLRESLREVGGEYKIYKNTLVRFAIENLDLEIDDLLSGPTAIAFVGKKPDGTSGDPVSVAKALKDFAKKNEALVIKGGVLENRRLTVEEINQLAEIAPRDVLLSQLAGLLVAPMQQFAGLLNALPQKFAYALQALIEKSGGVKSGGVIEEADDASDSVAEEEESSEADDASDSVTEEEESSEADDASDSETEEKEA